MTKIYYAQDCNLGLLKDKTVAISATAARDMRTRSIFMKAALTLLSAYITAPNRGKKLKMRA